MTDRMIIGTNKSPTNPTPLSAPQEQQVKDLYYKNVRAKCAKEIETFAQCALGRTFTMIYACRQSRLAMNSCMLQYQNQDELDKARLEWFALAEERRQARIEHQRKLEDAREKHKEWWNLDESGRTVGKAAETVNEAGLRRREENRVDASGVTRGGVYGSR
ncbi:unnamed protein product [Alternaria alternata]|uniref:uncharacterized protein n=1 Tax=Alternaria postmessia TaxID=1187938 RepID=UPI002224FB46|nr:uncharacterized protein J4E82_006036 [Alternaria postmessia]KAI5375168.1 hypothetical protein J4E82_006036 [Alternaria postmessia]